MRRVLHVDCADGSSRLQVPEVPVLGPVDYALRAGAPRDELVLGVGPLGQAAVPGANRLVLCGWSPAWEGFFVSTMGSAGLALRGLGIDALALSGRAPRPALLTVHGGGGGRGGREGAPRVSLEPFDLDVAFAPLRGGSGRPGTYAVLERLHRGAGGEPLRVLTTGPAARLTRSGALASAVGRDGEIVLETWAGRGGMGSLLLQRHGVAAIAFRGVADPPAPRAVAIDPADVRAATRKYRYAPDLRTGGTLGANLTRLGPLLLSFNARSVGWPLALRERLHERLVAGHYLRQYNDEIVVPRRFRDCGETCPAVCKKVGEGGYKKDFQPYAALGPNAGIFDQRAAEALADHADALGFDSVDVGGLVAWTLELCAAGLADARALGVDPADVRFPGADGAVDPDAFDPAHDSAHNARAGRALVDAIAAGRAPVLAAGLRAAARALGPDAAARAAYVAHGDGDGGLSPAQYWVPGMVAPMPVMGKYYVDYSFEWKPPDELGRSCVRRMGAELALDNLGLCRFQREWAEDRLDELLAAALGGEAAAHAALGGAADVEAHHLALTARIDRGARPRPWETARVRALVAGYVQEAAREGPREPALDAWAERFSRDAGAAADAYWRDLRRGIEEELAAAAGSASDGR
ncbi:MAG TPA: aldehyde ferredoxin oxidoreductase N-terminal domain-containing protein [Myxococcota bacterium]|jgi:glyceraldehyde-3-phosphate dehydrogenase (ferredoxin)|nr:aldehyde ferredoxin oxidoreductase N-terminal domain-containing protein [Myxococcota bacterium]